MSKNPKEVIAGVKHVLKPGGRFVAEFGGYLNCAGKDKYMTSAMLEMVKKGQETLTVKKEFLTAA
jgi:hypothetical protein